MNPLTDETYRTANQRRAELLNQWHGGFTAEEIGRRFDEHPGWLAEFGRRSCANLAAAEWLELDQLQEAIDEYHAGTVRRSRQEIKRADRLVNRALDRIDQDKTKQKRSDPFGVEVEWFIASISTIAVFLLLLTRVKHLFPD